MSAGTRLREARERAKLSQEQVAEAVGLKVRTIARYEEEDKPPHSGAVRLALARAVGADPDVLFPGGRYTVGLAAAMERAGRTTNDIARDLGIARKTIEGCCAGDDLGMAPGRQALAHYLGVPHDALWPRSPLPPRLPRLATGRRATSPVRRAVFDPASQTGRVLAALKAAGPRGITGVDFLAPDVIDGASPIMRLPSRIDELRQAGHEIDSSQRRGKVAVYRLIREALW